MTIENEFTEALKTLDADGRELTLSEEGMAEITCPGGVKMTFVVPASAQDTVYCRAELGALEGLDEGQLAIAFLKDNFMWQTAAGGTFSYRDGRAYLSDRRDSRYFASTETLADYIAAFASAVRLARERMELFRRASAVKEVR